MDKHSWLGGGAEKCFNSFFEAVDKHISDMMIRHHTRNEEFLTGIFLSCFRTPEYFVYYNSLRSCLNDKRPPYGPIWIDMNVITHSKYLESRTGADFGIILEYKTRNVKVKKAVLVQAKRLYPDSNGNFTADSKYVQITDSSQAENMLEVSPDSFFLLYNPPTFLFSPDSMQVRGGLQMIPATTIAGFDFKEPLTPRKFRGHTTAFGSLMVREFIRCSVGDSSVDVVRIASGGDRKFPVKHTFRFALGQEGVKLAHNG